MCFQSHVCWKRIDEFRHRKPFLGLRRLKKLRPKEQDQRIPSALEAKTVHLPGLDGEQRPGAALDITEIHHGSADSMCDTHEHVEVVAVVTPQVCTSDPQPQVRHRENLEIHIPLARGPIADLFDVGGLGSPHDQLSDISHRVTEIDRAARNATRNNLAHADACMSMHTGFPNTPTPSIHDCFHASYAPFGHEDNDLS